MPFAQDDVHPLCDLGDFGARNGVLDDQPSVSAEKSDLIGGGFAIVHRSANSACKRL